MITPQWLKLEQSFLVQLLTRPSTKNMPSGRSKRFPCAKLLIKECGVNFFKKVEKGAKFGPLQRATPNDSRVGPIAKVLRITCIFTLQCLVEFGGPPCVRFCGAIEIFPGSDS